MPGIILDPDEIKEITNRTRVHAQARMLRAMGIAHKPRADGSLVVLRSHVEKLLGGSVESKGKAIEPDWGAI